MDSMQIIKPYFGKFQPNLYLLVDAPKDSTITINTENMNKQDILKDFKTIDPSLKFTPLLISGTVRFSVRGKYYTDEKYPDGTKRDWFEIQPEGEHLLTCVWWKEQQKGIDDYTNIALYWHRSCSTAKTSGYDYIVTKIEE